MRLRPEAGAALFLTSCVEEKFGVLDKQLRILVVDAMVGVGIEDELRIGDVLLQQVGVDGRDDDVVVAVDVQGRLTQILQVGVDLVLLRTIGANGGGLGPGPSPSRPPRRNGPSNSPEMTCSGRP